jgi:hypothetical protein
MFLLDLMDNLPRHRISDSMMKMFIWVLKEAGACEVPSFDQFRKVQSCINREGAMKTLEFKSAKGNVFHMLDPRPILANVCQMLLVQSARNF